MVTIVAHLIDLFFREVIILGYLDKIFEQDCLTRDPYLGVQS